MALQSVESLGAYRVVRFLGAGGMGSVYEVEHAVMRTRHAMKVLGDQYRRSPAVRERLRREAQLMFQLGAHPHIVRATDYVETDDAAGVVIDLLDGGDLGQSLDARPGPLPWHEACRILEPIVSAVAFAHASHVVHRDLKPENVLLRRDGTWPGVPMVADFGIAKVLGSEHATRTQARMGTAGYGAPEQFRNAKEVGPEADVWSLGMLTYRLVTGALPVDPEDNMALLKLYEGLTPVPRLTGVPDAVAHAVEAALNPDPGQRPRDAGVFGKLLAVEAASWVAPQGHAAGSLATPEARAPRSSTTSSDEPPVQRHASASRPSKSALGLVLASAGVTVGALTFGLIRAAAPPAPDAWRQEDRATWGGYRAWAASDDHRDAAEAIAEHVRDGEALEVAISEHAAERARNDAAEVPPSSYHEKRYPEVSGTFEFVQILDRADSTSIFRASDGLFVLQLSPGDSFSAYKGQGVSLTMHNRGESMQLNVGSAAMFRSGPSPTEERVISGSSPDRTREREFAARVAEISGRLSGRLNPSKDGLLGPFRARVEVTSGGDLVPSRVVVSDRAGPVYCLSRAPGQADCPSGVVERHALSDDHRP